MRSLLSEWAEIIRGAIVMVLWAAAFPIFVFVESRVREEIR